MPPTVGSAGARRNGPKLGQPTGDRLKVVFAFGVDFHHGRGQRDFAGIEFAAATLIRQSRARRIAGALRETILEGVHQTPQNVHI